MMAYDFDKVIPRRNTECIKFDGAISRGKPADILPLWVADMDFPAPACILDALHERVTHGIFGYSEPGAAYFDALKNWFTGRFGYEFQKQWVTPTPGVVFAICAAMQAFTAEGDAVLIQEPVYYPFRSSVEDNRRRLVVNELQLSDDAYTVDFSEFERQIARNNVKMFILCSPHNPGGRVWTADELREMVRICAKYDVLILSDEIHCDFVFRGHRHHVLPALCPEMQDRIILCTAPSKTFNLAGLQISNIFISNQQLRRAFRHAVEQFGYSQVNGLGLVACRAAYENGAPWLSDLLAYLAENMDRINRHLKAHLPAVRLIPPQGTYLAWLDCRALDLTMDALEHKLVHKAKLWLSRGDNFGIGGEGFIRLNAACPRQTLETGLARFSETLG